ncbi:MAG: hypothetical protein ACREBE_17940, partial [bacterium]
MSAELVPVAMRPDPFKPLERIETAFELGITVEELLRRLDVLNRTDLDLRVMVGDQIVKREQWPTRVLTDSRELVAINSVPGPPVIGALIVIGANLAAAATATASAIGLGGAIAGAATGAGLAVGGGLAGTFVAFGTAIVLGAAVNYA